MQWKWNKLSVALFNAYIFRFPNLIPVCKPTGSRYQPNVEESSYKVSMRIVIYNVTSKDFGTYRCVCKNSLGDTEGTIKLYSKFHSRDKEKYNLTMIIFQKSHYPQL